jgi:hypothetical protein
MQCIEPDRKWCNALYSLWALIGQFLWGPILTSKLCLLTHTSLGQQSHDPYPFWHFAGAPARPLPRSTVITMSGNAGASDVLVEVDSDNGSVAGSDDAETEENTIAAQYQNLTEIAVVVSTWVVEKSSKYTRHLELGVNDLTTNLALTMSSMEYMISNPEHTPAPDFWRSYGDVVANYEELSEHFKAMADEKRRRLTPQNSAE